MRIESGYIVLRGVCFHAFHGVLPQERRVGADFVLNLRVGYSLSVAIESDRVDDTLSYAALYELAAREMAQPSALLEHVAGRIVKVITGTFPEVTSIDLELLKRNPPMGGDMEGAGVEIHVMNEKTIEEYV